MDEFTEAEFTFLMEVIRAVREIRALHNIPPNQKLKLLVKASGSWAGVLDRLDYLLLHMAVLESADVSSDMERPATAAAQIVGNVEVYVPGLIDPVKERERLTVKLARIVEDIQKSESRLQNADFVKRAPAAIVERERQKLSELQTQMASLETALKELS